MSNELEAREELHRQVEMTEVGQHMSLTPAPSAASDDIDEYGLASDSRGQWATAFHRFVRSPRSMFGFVVFFGILITAFIYDLLNPLAYQTITNNVLQPPSAGNWFGTDELGKNVFAEVMKGTIQDIQVAFVVMIMAVTIGTLVGAIAGFYGGKIDNLLMRFVDLILVIPVLIILILLAHLISGSSSNWLYLALIIGAVAWTYIARLVRADLLSLREREFVEASRALGSSDWQMIRRHLIPNAIGPIVVNATLTVAGAITIEATLSFLGLGIQPPGVSLGALIANNQDSANTFWWLFAFPTGMLLILILCVFFIGDGIQSALDPKKSRVRA